MQKKILLGICGVVLVAALAGGGYMYATRPLEGSNSSIAAVGDQLNKTYAGNTGSGSTVESFRIDATRSKATFKIFEVLSGKDKIVVGTTDQVAGTLLVDRSDPTKSSASPILVSARTLKTDASSRDNAIARFVLKSEDMANEFITFKPGKIEGLPLQGVEGTTYPLTINGDMTIAGTTRPMSFTSTATYKPGSILHVTATGKIKRGDYNLIIPSVSFVADVSEEVTIELDLTAVR